MVAVPELGGVATPKKNDRYVLTATIIFVILALLAIVTSLNIVFDRLDVLEAPTEAITPSPVNLDENILREVRAGNLYLGCVPDTNSFTPYQLPLGNGLSQNRVKLIIDCPGG